MGLPLLERQHRGRAAGPISPDRRHGDHRPGNRPGQQRRVVLDVGAAQSAAGRLHLPARSIRRQQHPADDAGRAVLVAGGAGHGRSRSGQRVRRPVAARRRHRGAAIVAAVGVRHAATRDGDRCAASAGWSNSTSTIRPARRCWPARSPNRTATIEQQQVSLPERVSIRLPPAGLKFKIDLGAVQINQLAGDRQQLWTLPTFEGYPQYDLGGAAPGTPLPGGTTMRQQAQRRAAGRLSREHSAAGTLRNAAFYDAPPTVAREFDSGRTVSAAAAIWPTAVFVAFGLSRADCREWRRRGMGRRCRRRFSLAVR